jgi:ArsR family transcriptional regulator, arsenate/arsenite/antimonite-responsive transcriptional repressor
MGMTGETRSREQVLRISDSEYCQIFKALADPNRLRIFAVLLQGDSCNARLHKRLGLAPNLLSHHLGVLRQAGLIVDQRDTVDARWIYYMVDRSALTKFFDWLNQFFDPAQLDSLAYGCRTIRPIDGESVVAGCNEPGDD